MDVNKDGDRNFSLKKMWFKTLQKQKSVVFKELYFVSMFLNFLHRTNN